MGKTTVVLTLALVMVSMATVESRVVDKRFFFGDIGDMIKEIFNSAKKIFYKIMPDDVIDFDGLVDKLDNFIRSDPTEQFCVKTCTNAAAELFQSESYMAVEVCPWACEAALAKLGVFINPPDTTPAADF